MVCSEKLSEIDAKFDAKRVELAKLVPTKLINYFDSKVFEWSDFLESPYGFGNTKAELSVGVYATFNDVSDYQFKLFLSYDLEIKRSTAVRIAIARLALPNVLNISLKSFLNSYVNYLRRFLFDKGLIFKDDCGEFCLSISPNDNFSDLVRNVECEVEI